MADATQSRSNASRAEKLRLAIPRLEDTRTVGSSTAFSGDEDQPLDQALAILSLLSSAFSSVEVFRGCDDMERGGITYPNLLSGKRGGIVAEALDGVVSLIALSRHFGDVKRVNRENALNDQEGQ